MESLLLYRSHVYIIHVYLIFVRARQKIRKDQLAVYGIYKYVTVRARCIQLETWKKRLLTSELFELYFHHFQPRGTNVYCIHSVLSLDVTPSRFVVPQIWPRNMPFLPLQIIHFIANISIIHDCPISSFLPSSSFSRNLFFHVKSKTIFHLARNLLSQLFSFFHKVSGLQNLVTNYLKKFLNHRYICYFFTIYLNIVYIYNKLHFRSVVFPIIAFWNCFLPLETILQYIDLFLTLLIKEDS